MYYWATMSSTPKNLPQMTQQGFDINTTPVTNPGNVPSVYANNAAVMQMPHDFRIVFSEVVAEGPANLPRLELRASIAISPTMLKGLQQAIETTLANFEKQQGEIKWPPQQPKTK